MTLTEQELNQIRAESERLYHVHGGLTVRLQEWRMAQRTGYIAAATKYQEMAKGLVESVKSAIDNVEYPHISKNTLCIALTNFNESLKG